MKTGFRCVFFVLTFLAAQTFAGDKVYDQTGILKFQSGGADFHASSEVDGQTYNSYCYTGPDSVECHEGVDGAYIVEMEDGRRLYVDLARHTSGGLLGFRNPLLALAMDHSGDVKIRFRLIEHCSILKYGDPCTFSDRRTMFCIPYVDGAGKPSKEACYAITLISSVNGLPPPQKAQLSDTMNPAVVTDSEEVEPPPSAVTKSGTAKLPPEVLNNSEAAKSSPAAAAAMANVGHPQTPQELAQLVQSGQASKCAVVTAPPGAEVYVDGNKLGVSPLVFVLLKMGEARTVTIKLDGYKTVEKTYIPDGKTIPIGFTLEKDPH